MRRLLTLLSIVPSFICRSQDPQDLRLWYKQPAAEWVEALPLGNGRLGAMVFGGTANELIQLNESSLYSGGPVKFPINPTAYESLQPLRAALAQGDFSSAAVLAKKMQGLYTQSYMPLGDLRISQSLPAGDVTTYQRELDIDRAVATTRFMQGGVTFTRTAFVSAPAGLMIIRITASRPGSIAADISTSSPLRGAHANAGSDLILNGRAPAHVDPNYYRARDREPVIYEDPTGCSGMRFQLRVKAVTKGGSQQTDSSAIHVRDASELTLYVAAATSFNGFDKCPLSQGKDEKKIVISTLNAAAAKPLAQLEKEHVADYRKYFRRVSFTLTDTPNRTMPSDERLRNYTAGAKDLALETLYYQFGRYLLISSSRPGGPPANLQGIWNKELRAPWSSNYTININTQMNYWPAEPTNLSEMHLPLLSWIGDLSNTGAQVAREFYHARGWVAHHNSEIWGTANPVGDKGAGDPVWANWYMGGNWLSQHLWEHYSFTGDKEYLRNHAYPIMRSAAQFTLDWLIEDGKGHLVTGPSTSPENKFKDANGTAQSVSTGTTMDLSIIRDLFTNVLQAIDTLQVDALFRDSILNAQKRLLPLQIGTKGQLQEWSADFEETDPLHRHVSHLFGLHPGREISAQQPSFFNAAKRTLELRGDEGTGWSKGWKINFWARLLDGDHAYSLIRQLLTYVNTSTGSMRGGGTYPNFFDAHPPFQIDGNFGGTAGMTEMLLQSHLGEINLLPALPSAWPEGKITGLRARGGYVVSIEWNNSQLVSATITANNNGNCSIRSAIPLQLNGVSSSKDGEGYLLKFNAKKGASYLLTPSPQAMTAYLFTYFTGNAKPDEAVRFGVSKDGVHWRALNDNKAVISSEKISSTGGVRDPHILRGHDGKTFYMVVTDMVSALGWNSNRAMVLLKSSDLVNWTSAVVNIQKRFPGNDSLLRVWAPQTIYDARAKKYMVYFSMKHGKDPDKIYYCYANKDFTDLETAPVQLFYSPTNGACIDGDIVYKDGKYHLFFKTEGQGAGIKIAVSDSLTGGYVLRDKYVHQTKDPVEGAGVFPLSNGDEYVLMYDVYTKGRYQFTKTKDFENYTVIDSLVTMNFHPRHGTVIQISTEELKRLTDKWHVDMNPVLEGLYADPYVMYSRKNNKFYIYPTSDGFTNWTGTYFKTFSSTDLQHWRDEGVILDLPRDVSWGPRNAWAPTIIEKRVNGKYKYFYYFTAAQKIGVAVSDEPTGPFKDSGRPLVAQHPEGIRRGQEIDPDVFQDPVSGKTYLFWGNGYLACAELNDDMTSFKEETRRVISTDSTFREGAHIFYRKGKYYYSWSENDTRDENYRVRYGYTNELFGKLTIPTQNLVIAKDSTAGILGTGHHSVIQIPRKDEWYIVYHRFNYPNPPRLGRAAGYNRETCIDKLEFNADGTIRKVTPTHKGISPIKLRQ